MFDFDTDTREIFIYDEIGPAWWGLIDAGVVRDALSQMRGQRVTVRLNTPGGAIDEGVAIFNLLREHKGGVDTVADSLAASMGLYILQAGERRLIASNAAVMIHDPWSVGAGNAAELRKYADVLDKYRDRMVPDYAERSGKSKKQIEAIMAAETWYTATEAIDAGFADALASDEDAIAPAASAEPRKSRLRSSPADRPETPESPRDFDTTTAVMRRRGHPSTSPWRRFTCRMFGIEYKTARKAVMVSRATESGLRRPLLSWHHHKEVAGREDQEELLRWAPPVPLGTSRRFACKVMAPHRKITREPIFDGADAV